jgi:hypothetical protein
VAFLNPLLLFGIVGIASPIIIHLLAQKKIKRVVWAAMKFLKEVVEKNQRRLTLEDLILLILRCCVLVFLALAMARPSFKQGGFGGFGGSNEAAIIALDNSASMSQSDGVSSKFDSAQKAAEQVLDALPSGSAVAVWLVSDVVKGVIPEPTHDFALARKVIRQAQRSDRATEMPSAVRQAVEVLQRQTTVVKQIFLITDGQAAGWKQLSDTRALLDAVKKEMQTRLVIIGESEQHNLGITGLRMSSALAPVNQSVRFEVEVANYGVEEAKNVQVSLAVDAEPPGDEAGIESIPAGESKKISLFVQFRDAGFHSVTAHIPTDRSPADDQRAVAVRVIGEINVLLVDGDPGVEPRESEVFFLRNALVPVAPEQREKYYIKAKTVSPAELQSAKLGDYEAVVLANVADVPETVLASLDKYLRAGGGLIVFPGGKISASYYNDKLFTERGFLPAAFGDARGKEPAGDAEQTPTFHLQAKGYDHPIVSIWKDPASGSPATANFYRAFTLLPAKSDVPRPDAGPPALVLSYADGSPAVMERTFGYGRVIQFSSTADSAWNDLCIRPIFVPLVHRVLGALVTRQDEHLNLHVGAKLSYVMDAEMIGKDVTIAKPGGKKEATALRRIALSNGLPLLQFDETDMAGVYDVRMGEDATPMLRFATQADPGESRLEELSAADLRVFDGVAQVIRWTPERGLKSLLQKERTGSEFWLAFAILALGVAIAETWLGNKWSQSK